MALEDVALGAMPQSDLQAAVDQGVEAVRDNPLAAYEAIAALLPYAAAALGEDHAAVRYARRLGITAKTEKVS